VAFGPDRKTLPAIGTSSDKSLGSVLGNRQEPVSDFILSEGNCSAARGAGMLPGLIRVPLTKYLGERV
jgi:hypothetical protein